MPELGLETQETFSGCISTIFFFLKFAFKLSRGFFPLKVKRHPCLGRNVLVLASELDVQEEFWELLSLS